MTSVALHATLPEIPTKSAAELTVGEYLRQHVIPAGMSVKEAANRLGVGRPALSNLLNGNAALSSDMAVRLEKSFGVDRQKLLDMQAAADRAKQREAERAVAVRRYVPNFLSIKARQIETWTEDHLDARLLLPVLLRRLVHSTGHDLPASAAGAEAYLVAKLPGLAIIGVLREQDARIWQQTQIDPVGGIMDAMVDCRWPELISGYFQLRIGAANRATIVDWREGP